MARKHRAAARLRHEAAQDQYRGLRDPQVAFGLASILDELSRHLRDLDEAVELLERIVAEGLLAAIGDGTFAGMRRPPDGGRGLDGVVRRAPGYVNPAIDLLEEGP